MKTQKLPTNNDKPLLFVILIAFLASLAYFFFPQTKTEYKIVTKEQFEIEQETTEMKKILQQELRRTND